MKNPATDWEEYDRAYSSLGPRFSFHGPCECFMCGKKIMSVDSRVLIQVMDDGPCGNVHVDCVNNMDTEEIVRRHMEALEAAMYGSKEKGHQPRPVVDGRML